MKDLYIITGATGGMGEDATRRFKEYGDVLLLDLSEEKLNKLAEELGEGARAMSFDITKKEDIEKVIEVIKEYGSFKALLHFAGVSENMGDPAMVLNINLVGTINLLNALYDYAKEGTVIVNTASMTAHMTPIAPEIEALLPDVLNEESFNKVVEACGGISALSYGWSKIGVMNLSKNDAAKWGEKGARIVSISPGAILTPMVQHEIDNGNAKTIEILIAATPAKRIGYPSDITNMCEYLCSDKASFITGIDILVDGGSTQAMKNYHAAHASNNLRFND